MAKYTFASPRPNRGATGVLAVLLVLSLGLNVYLLFFQDRGGAAGDGADAGADAGTAPGDDVPIETDADGDTGGPTADPDRSVGDFTALEALDLEVRGSLSQVFDGAVPGRRGIWLTATTGRVLVWWVDMSKDLRSGDRIQVAYEAEGEEEVRIAAVAYRSLKMDREYQAYYFKRQADTWGSYWDSEGREVPARLKDSPMEEYMQITALLGDGRDHRGIDFRAPTGTPVFASKDATVVRTTWNFKYNGNSLELRYGDGTLARYLHLEGIEEGVTAGARIAKGQQVATCGNTGRTNAPHLHYELEQAGRIIDPLDYHGTVREQLEGPELETFLERVEQFDALLEGAGSGGDDPGEQPEQPEQPAA